MGKKKISLIFFLILTIFGLTILSLGYFYEKSESENKVYQEKIKKVLEVIKGEKIPAEKFQFGSFPILAKENFFEKTKKELIKQRLDFLLVDLSQKKLDFFEKGNLEKTYKVLTIGKKGSFWETPAGLYQVEAKIKNAFSSTGRVYMPYSLQFQGNFFIHGWPYYPNGTPVRSSYSGGCIRLSTADAKEIFKKVKIGTPILITENGFLRDNFSYQLKTPKITAKAFLAADLKSNFVFLAKDSKTALPIASITKLITALVSCEYTNLWQKIKIQKSDLIFTSKPRLKIGESYTGFDLLYPLLMESSNEAAKALSRFLGEERFVEIMRKKAKSMGMENAQFKDCWGKSKEDVASAEDLFSLAKYLLNNRKFILDITKGKVYYGLISREFENLENFNYPGKEEFIGGKVGKTAIAGETALSIFNLEFRGEKRPIVIIVLGSKDSLSDTKKVLNWLKESFE